MRGCGPHSHARIRRDFWGLIMEKRRKVIHVYGRKKYESPLAFVKKLEGNEIVKSEILKRVGEEGWVELVAIPAEAFIPVTRKESDG